MGDGQAETAKLQTLYTKHVLPNAMLALWNNGHRNGLCHVVQADQDPATERPRVVANFVKWIVTNLLRVGSSPTLSRFFTFRDCIDNMHTMMLIGLPQHVLQVRSTKPRKEGKKRLRLVNACFQHDEASQLLRRTCLTFQLTGGVEALVSEVPQADRPPLMVRLCQGEATTRVRDRLRDILVSIAASDDPSLNIGASVSTLLSVGMELVVRMRQFVGYPAALCRMSKQWFPHGAVNSVHAFLATDPKDLDVGASLQLHTCAWECGSELTAASRLLNKPVQQLLASWLRFCCRIPCRRSGHTPR